MKNHEEVLEYVREHAVAARLIAPQSPMPTVPLAAAALGVPEGKIVKTIVFETKSAVGGRQSAVEDTEDRYRRLPTADRRPGVAVAIVTGDVRVDRSRVAAVLNLPTLKLASPETVVRVTGFEVGGVPPVAHVSAVPVVVDRGVLAHDIVYGGGGDEDHMLEIAPKDIVRLTNAIVADITLEGGGES